MNKVLTGKITSIKMQDSSIVEVIRRTPHKLYGKLLKRSKNYNVDTKGHVVVLGNTVKIVETKPISKYKHFKIQEVIKEKKI